MTVALAMRDWYGWEGLLDHAALFAVRELTHPPLHGASSEFEAIAHAAAYALLAHIQGSRSCM